MLGSKERIQWIGNGRKFSQDCVTEKLYSAVDSMLKPRFSRQQIKAFALWMIPKLAASASFANS